MQPFTEHVPISLRKTEWTKAVTFRVNFEYFYVNDLEWLAANIVLISKNSRKTPANWKQLEYSSNIFGTHSLPFDNFFFILYSSPFEFQTDYSSTCDRIRWPLPQNIENIWTHRNSSGKHFYSIWMRTPKRKSEQCIKYTRGETSFVLRIARLAAAAAAVVCFFFLFRKNAQCSHFLIEYIFQHLLNIQLFHSLMEWASKCGWSDAREHTLTFTSCTQMFHCLSRPYVYTNDKYANSTTILSTIRKQRKKNVVYYRKRIVFEWKLNFFYLKKNIELGLWVEYFETERFN